MAFWDDALSSIGNFFTGGGGEDAATAAGNATLGSPWDALTGDSGGGGILSAGTLAVLGGAQVGSALIGSEAAKSAAETQAEGQTNAANITANNQGQIRADLAPFKQLGYDSLPQVEALTGTNPGGNPLTAALTKPFTPDDLTNTPGYKFTLQQGLNAVKNSNIAVGHGPGSGPLGKGLADYASGLASTTYNDQLKNYLAQNLQTYNMLTGNVGTGEAAAAQTGAFGTTNNKTISDLLSGSAASQAGGTVGQANALTGATGNLQQLLLTNALLGGMYGNRGASANGVN